MIAIRPCVDYSRHLLRHHTCIYRTYYNSATVNRQRELLTDEQNWFCSFPSRLLQLRPQSRHQIFDNLLHAEVAQCSGTHNQEKDRHPSPGYETTRPFETTQKVKRFLYDFITYIQQQLRVTREERVLYKLKHRFSSGIISPLWDKFERQLLFPTEFKTRGLIYEMNSEEISAITSSFEQILSVLFPHWMDYSIVCPNSGADSLWRIALAMTEVMLGRNKHFSIECVVNVGVVLTRIRVVLRLQVQQHNAILPQRLLEMLRTMSSGFKSITLSQQLRLLLVLSQCHLGEKEAELVVCLLQDLTHRLDQLTADNEKSMLEDLPAEPLGHSNAVTGISPEADSKISKSFWDAGYYSQPYVLCLLLTVATRFLKTESFYKCRLRFELARVVFHFLLTAVDNNISDLNVEQMCWLARCLGEVYCYLPSQQSFPLEEKRARIHDMLKSIGAAAVLQLNSTFQEITETSTSGDTPTRHHKKGRAPNDIKNFVWSILDISSGFADARLLHQDLFLLITKKILANPSILDSAPFPAVLHIALCLFQLGLPCPNELDVYLNDDRITESLNKYDSKLLEASVLFLSHPSRSAVPSSLYRAVFKCLRFRLRLEQVHQATDEEKEQSTPRKMSATPISSLDTEALIYIIQFCLGQDLQDQLCRRVLNNSVIHLSQRVHSSTDVTLSCVPGPADGISPAVSPTAMTILASCVELSVTESRRVSVHIREELQRCLSMLVEEDERNKTARCSYLAAAQR